MKTENKVAIRQRKKNSTENVNESSKKDSVEKSDENSKQRKRLNKVAKPLLNFHQSQFS